MAKQRYKPASGQRPKPAGGSASQATLQDDELLSNDQAAAFLKISPETLLTWRCRHRGPAYYKIGRFAYYRVADIKTWRETQRREPREAVA